MNEGDAGDWLVFMLGEHAFRAPASSVQGIESYQPGEPLPYDTPIEGLLPLRGELVAVVNVEVASSESERPQRLVILRTPRGLLGVGCSAVRGIEEGHACDDVPLLGPDQMVRYLLKGEPPSLDGPLGGEQEADKAL